MDVVFLKALNMSISASWLILAVMAARVLLKKAPRWVCCLLWGLAGIRLACPFSLESALSLVPSNETIPLDIALQKSPSIDSGIQIVNDTVNPMIADSLAPEPAASANPLQVIVPIAAIVWISGIVIMLVYAMISYLRLRKIVSASVPIEERIFACDEAGTPFILGVFQPRIYVPSSLDKETLPHVIRHEKAHLQRHDHWWKPLGFLLLAIHWFNPLCWIAYVLFCRDIETACDEKVIRNMDKDGVAGYSQALLDCSYPRKAIAACPLAFGEAGVKERVKGVLQYRKPAAWIIILAITACIALAICLLTDPFSRKSLPENLAASMDLAIASHHHSDYTGDHFVAVDYEVLKVTESRNTTTVYALVLYEEYRYDGRDVSVDTGSWGPTAITFDVTTSQSASSYEVKEYWEPRDGSYYVKDIREKFPWSIQAKAFDNTRSNAQHERCLQAAREHYKMNPNPLVHSVFGSSYQVNEILYDDGASPVAFARETLPEYRLSTNKELLIKEDLQSDAWLNAGSFTETTLSEETFDNCFPEKGRSLAKMLRKENDKAWQLVVSDLPESVYYHLLVQKNGEVYLTYGYYHASNPEDSRIRYVFSLKEDSKHTETTREKYPEYFGLPTDNGLEVYVWQVVPGNYSCGLLPGTNREKTQEELWSLKGTTVEEMKEILSTYEIPSQDIAVLPFQNPVSSYAYIIDEAYKAQIRNLFFSEESQGIQASTKTVYANWTEDIRIYEESLNLSIIGSDAKEHLPVYKLDSKKDLEWFQDTFGDILVLDAGYGEVPSFNDGIAGYDDTFFVTKSLLLAYVSANSGSYRYAVQKAYLEGSIFHLEVAQVNHPQTHTADMAGWLLIAEVLKDDIADVKAFDATLVPYTDPVGALFDVILSSPAASSNPRDYIDAHPEEVKVLLADRETTLPYILNEFQSGNQFGLKGHIMRYILDELVPEAKIESDAKTGQEYFDAWLENAKEILLLP